MQTRIKAGLVVGAVQFILSVCMVVASVILLCCPICIPVLGLFTGVVAGWLAVEWSSQKPERPLVDGAIAGGIASVGQLLGLILPIGGYLLLAQMPGFEDLITTTYSPDMTDVEILTSNVVSFVVIIIGVVLALGYAVVTGPGLGAVAAYYRANIKPFPIGSVPQPQQSEADVLFD
jgi:hypothetical protein